MLKIPQNNRRLPIFFVGAALFFVILSSLRINYPNKRLRGNNHGSTTSEVVLPWYNESIGFTHFYDDSKAREWSELQKSFDVEPSDLESISRGEPLANEWRPFLEELFDRLPGNFSSSYRNPCWYEDGTLRCLPYFYQLGSYKCGTTDLWDKVVQHPHVLQVAKEPHWWAWRRFGFTSLPIHGDLVLKIRNITGDRDDHSLQWYLNLYSYQATEEIRQDPKLVFGDASISNLWGLGDYKWEKKFPTFEEPPFFLAKVIRTFQPNAKITAILRDPVEKLWTTYMLGDRYKKVSFKKHFENLVHASTACEKKHTFKYCAFMHRDSPSSILSNHLYQGIYYVYLKEWVEAFGVGNVYVIRLEDWKNNTVSELNSVFQYLELDPLPEETMTSIVQRSAKNVNKNAKSRNMVMSQEMRRRVEFFYRPWNEKLVELLGNQKFMWDY